MSNEEALSASTGTGSTMGATPRATGAAVEDVTAAATAVARRATEVVAAGDTKRLIGGQNGSAKQALWVG